MSLLAPYFFGFETIIFLGGNHDKCFFRAKVARKGMDCNIRLKNIISFDLDFKQNVEEYRTEQREQLTEKFSNILKDTLLKHRVFPWMMVFSGNGLHLHFRLAKPYELTSIQNYRHMYNAMRCYLECISGLKFDPACSNPSRLMRLPFSTIRKDRDVQVPCVVLMHDREANFSPIFDGFRAMAEYKPSEEQKFVRDKQAIVSKLNLSKILNHFNYSKSESIKEIGAQIICSSPFKLDNNPSFYYDQQTKLFYDFSSGFGGDLFELIARLAKIDCKKDFANVIDLAAKICGIPANDTHESCFELNEKGIWFQSSKESTPQWLSSPIFVEALTRDSSNQSWGRLLTLKDQDGVIKSWSMPMELLAGDGSEIRRNLLDLGAELAVGKRERQHFLAFLQSSRPANRARCVNRIGWHKNQFVLPDRIISSAEEEAGIILQESRTLHSFGVSGELIDWQENVGKYCVGNSRLVLAVSSALASVLLKGTGEESGGFNFVGPSSIGKSITLKVAASVWGNPGLNGFIKRWRSTLNGLELLAASRCDSLLILDELGEIQPKDAGNAAYVLCGGISKNRATKDANLASQFEWRLLLLIRVL